MKHSSEMYEKSSERSVTVFSDETEIDAWKCRACGASVQIRSTEITPRDIKHAISELACLTTFLSGNCPKGGNHEPGRARSAPGDLGGEVSARCVKCGVTLGTSPGWY